MKKVHVELTIEKPERQVYKKDIELEGHYLKVLYKQAIEKKELTPYEQDDYGNALREMMTEAFGGGEAEWRAHLFRRGVETTVTFSNDDVKAAYEELVAEGKI